METGSDGADAVAAPKVLVDCPKANGASVVFGALAPNWNTPEAGGFDAALPKEKLLAGVDCSAGFEPAPKVKVELGAALLVDAAAPPNWNTPELAVVVVAAAAPKTFVVVDAGAAGAPNTLEEAVVVGAPKANVDDLVSGLLLPKVNVLEGADAVAAVVVAAGAPPKVLPLNPNWKGAELFVLLPKLNDAPV